MLPPILDIFLPVYHPLLLPPNPYPLSLSLSAVNYVAVTDALAASPSVVTAALAADNLLCALYFPTLFALAANIGPEGREGETFRGGEEVSEGVSGME